MKQNVKMGWQEGVEVGERLAVEAGLIELGVRKLGMLAQRLPVAVKQRAKLRGSDGGFAQQATYANFLDVAGFERDRDREAILQLVKFWRVDCRSRIIFSQCLLCGA